MFPFWRHRRARVTILAAIAVLLVALQVVTFRRVPTPTADGQLYASIVLAVARTGAGIPTMFERSPLAVDHMRFYGPGYFLPAAIPVRYLGVSPESMRLTSLLGTLLLVGAAAWLAFRLSGSGYRALLAAVLMLMAPELARANLASTMHPVAVAFELLALAAFAGAAMEPERRAHGLLAGVLLGVAVLTIPRTFPFAGAFALAALLTPGNSAALRRQCGVALVVCGGMLLVWAVVARGGVGEWVRFMAGLLVREDRDVAVLPFATRTWQLGGASLVTPLVAIGAALAAARRTASLGSTSQAPTANPAIGFLLVWTWVTFVVTTALMNYPGGYRIYSIVPLFAVVIALPYRALGFAPRVLSSAVVLLMVVDAGVASVRWARIAATWDRRDPDLLQAFVKTHVPEGSAVIGPGAPFFTAVEQSRSRFLHWSPHSLADWARWVPEMEPESVAPPRSPTRFTGRFLLWLDREELPSELACASDRVARFEPPPSHLAWLGPLGHTEDVGFEAATLYRLQPGCPAGYDPTHAVPKVVALPVMGEDGVRLDGSWVPPEPGERAGAGSRQAPAGSS